MATTQLTIDPTISTKVARIPSLDGLRSISIAFVLIDHICYHRYFQSEPLVAWAINPFGYFGVKIFFVISGYLITLLMLNEEARTGRVSLRDFYIRRAFRILPPALMFMGVSFLYFGPAISLRDKILSLLFLMNYNHGNVNIGHLWSLGVEEQFYLLWPLVFIFWPGVRKKVLLGTMAVVPIINVAITRFDWPFWGSAFYSVGDTIAYGCLLAMMRQNRYVNRILDNRYFFLIPVLTCLVSWGCFVKTGVVIGLCKALILRPAVNVGVALTLEKFVRTAPAMLNTQPIVFIGMLSYSIYLWQQPITFSQRHLSPNWLLDLAIRLTLIGLLASASYFLLEQPFLKLRRRMLHNN